MARGAVVVKRGELQAKGNRRLPPVFRGQKRRIREEKEMEEEGGGKGRRKKSLLRSRYKRRRRRRHHMCSVVPAVRTLIVMVVQQGREPRMYCIFLFTFPILRYISFLPTAATCTFKFKDYVYWIFKALRSLFVSVVHRKKIFVHRAQTALQCCKLLQAHTDQIRPRRNLRENTLPINTCPRKKYFSLFRDCGR